MFKYAFLALRYWLSVGYPDFLLEILEFIYDFFFKILA